MLVAYYRSLGLEPGKALFFGKLDTYGSVVLFLSSASYSTLTKHTLF
jgi:hypothetical protein